MNLADILCFPSHKQAAGFQGMWEPCDAESLLDNGIDAAVPVVAAAGSVTAERMNSQTVSLRAADAGVWLTDSAAQAESHCDAKLSCIQVKPHRS